MSYKNPRINNLNMTVQDVIMKMCSGNPGAITVCVRLMEEYKTIDPDAMMGGLGAILALDSLDIYDQYIWMFYKDACKENLSTMCAVMRAYQLGQLEGCTEQTIKYAITNYGKGLDLDKIRNAVKSRLPAFKLN